MFGCCVELWTHAAMQTTLGAGHWAGPCRGEFCHASSSAHIFKLSCCQRWTAPFLTSQCYIYNFSSRRWLLAAGTETRPYWHHSRCKDPHWTGQVLDLANCTSEWRELVRCVVPRDTAETDHPDQGPAASGGHIAVCQHRHHQSGLGTNYLMPRSPYLA